MATPPPSDPPPAPAPRRPGRGLVLGVVALVAGALTGTLPFILPVVLLVLGVRWARTAGSVTVGRILTASEIQMAPALEALGFMLAEDGGGPRVPDEVAAEVLPGGERRVRRRFVPRADLRPLEIATAEVVGGISGMRRRAVITVAHELGHPDDAAAAATLLQASTLVGGGEVPDTARFGCAHGWVVAAFDPLRSRDPGAAAGALQAALARIVQDARQR